MVMVLWSRYKASHITRFFLQFSLGSHQFVSYLYYTTTILIIVPSNDETCKNCFIAP